MPRTPADDVHPVLPGCEPWSSPGGGPHGALVLHGFTGSPVSMRPLAEAMADAGFAVEMPRLPGHGTAVADLVETGWDDWLTEADRTLTALQARCQGGRVVVAGLSMGGALTAALAEGHPELAGIVLINAPVAAPPELAASLEEMLTGGIDVIDSVGGDTLARSWGVLRPTGRLVTIAASVEHTSEKRARDAFFIVEPNRAQLSTVARMIDAGELRPIVGAVFPLAEARQAYEHKPTRGKVVLAAVA